MTKHGIYLAWLCTQIPLTYKRFQYIESFYPDIVVAIEDNFYKISSQDWLSKYTSFDTQKIIDTQLYLQRQGIDLICIYDQNYPLNWKQLPDPPLVMYAQGDLNLLTAKPCLTVVGSRRIQSYTQRLADIILKPVFDSQVISISGLALGVDALVHQTSLKSSQSTIAIIGGGFSAEVFYPRENLLLKKSIINNKGLVLSEYPPNTPSLPFYFPRRNRLLAALSDVTLVLQASLKSGSLVTSSIARDMGKIVATVPASILDPNFQGNLQLLQQGAQIVCSPEDVFILLKWRVLTQPQPPLLPDLSQNQKIIFEAMSEPQDLDYLMQISKIDTNLLIQELNLMEMQGLISMNLDGLWQRL